MSIDTSKIRKNTNKVTLFLKEYIFRHTNIELKMYVLQRYSETQNSLTKFYGVKFYSLPFSTVPQLFQYRYLGSLVYQTFWFCLLKHK